MKDIFRYYWPAILWALFIFIMCTIKIGDVSSVPLFFPGFDKLVHCGFFFVIVVFSTTGYIRQQSLRNLPYKVLLITTLLAIVYGGIIELLQLYIFTWRSGEWNDLFADTVGSLMAAFSIFITVNALSYDKK